MSGKVLSLSLYLKANDSRGIEHTGKLEKTVSPYRDSFFELYKKIYNNTEMYWKI